MRVIDKGIRLVFDSYSIYFNLIVLILMFIKNVSSSTYHKKTPSLRLSVLRLSLPEFKKILLNTFIYESILIKIYINTNIMNTQIFHLKKYDLKGH